MPDVKVPGTRSPLARALAELAGPGPVTVLKQDRVVVVRSGDVVVKAHAPDADPADLAVRLATAARLGDVMLPPLRTAPERVAGRLVTRWPAGRPVDPADLAAAPWEDAGRLLARLHAVPVDGRLPPAGGPRRLARAMARLDRAGGGAAAAVVRAAYAGLPAAARHGTARRALTHGDWHLGQLVWRDGRWYLIDVDDLGARRPGLGSGPARRLVRGRAARPGGVAAVPVRLPGGRRDRGVGGGSVAGTGRAGPRVDGPAGRPRRAPGTGGGPSARRDGGGLRRLLRAHRPDDRRPRDVK